MTGIRAELHAMGLGRALRRMEAANSTSSTPSSGTNRGADLRILETYAEMEVPVFFHRNISGITDAWSLKGFPVGIMKGDAAVDFLRNGGWSG
jgi:hypothetical protein